jgi:hypothetical protein
MAKKKVRSNFPAGTVVPRDNRWTYHVFEVSDFGGMIEYAERFDGDDEDDWRIELYGLLEQVAIRALADRSLLDQAIRAIGRHMLFFPRISMGTPLGRFGLHRLLKANDDKIVQQIFDHANEWDAERQMNLYQDFALDTRDEEDPVLAEQINLLELQEKYNFKPKFGITASDMFPDDPIPIVKYYDLNEDL